MFSILIIIFSYFSSVKKNQVEILKSELKGLYEVKAIHCSNTKEKIDLGRINKSQYIAKKNDYLMLNGLQNIFVFFEANEIRFLIKTKKCNVKIFKRVQYNEPSLYWISNYDHTEFEPSNCENEITYLNTKTKVIYKNEVKSYFDLEEYIIYKKENKYFYVLKDNSKGESYCGLGNEWTSYQIEKV